jgi:hypothetical protein
MFNPTFILIFLSLLHYTVYVQAQPRCNINIHAELNNAPIELNHKTAINTQGDSILFSTLRFYMTSIEIKQQGSYNALDTIHSRLIDWSIPESHFISITLKNSNPVEQLHFILGVDSTLQYNGIGAGDLDPTKGMYWTWQSGYINFKLEATYYPPGKKEEQIALHIGGFQYPYNTEQAIALTTHSTAIHLIVNLDEIIIYSLQEKLKQVLSPGTHAVTFSKLMSHSFIIK